MKKEPNMKRVLLWSLLGFFGVMMVSNVIMFNLAQSSWNGITEKEPFQKGVAHNQTLEAFKKQEALSWNNQVRTSSESVEISYTDKNNAPVEALEVMLTFFRPTHEGADITMPMQEITAGTYKAATKPPLPGLWELRFQAKTANGKTFSTHERVVFK